MCLLFPALAPAQEVFLFDLNTDNFPRVEAKFYAFDSEFNQITDLAPGDFELTESGVPRQILDVSCTPPPEPPKLSTVLTIDVSGSMAGGNLDVAKSAAEAWIDGLPAGKFECAATSFSNASNIVQDFTVDRDLLNSRINSLTPGGGTNYEPAFLDPNTGNLAVAARGKHKKIVVFLSDGAPNKTPDVNAIISQANQNDITIYVVTLLMQAPQCLIDICNGTGGLCFEQVTPEDCREVFVKIQSIAKSAEPCTIAWQSDYDCMKFRNCELKLNRNNTTARAHYLLDIGQLSQLEFEPVELLFGGIEPMTAKTLPVTITARKRAITINGITPSNSHFTITDWGGSAPPFTLGIDQSRTLEIEFFATDSGEVSSGFEVESDACEGRFFWAKGGYPGIPPKEKTLRLVHPNGGERFMVGIDTVITWTGVVPSEPVLLEYSTDAGATWNEIARGVSGFNYKWTDIPDTPSEDCLARVTIGVEKEIDTVKICDKVWMKRNLDVAVYRNGDSIRHARTPEEWQDASSKQEGAWCYYDNDPENGKIYGKLYNGYAVNDKRGLAPEGWHVPSDEEWMELEICLGMSAEVVDKFGVRGTDEGNKLKSTGTIENGDGYWNESTGGATNSSGFNALPGGILGSSAGFNWMGDHATFWTSTENIREQNRLCFRTLTRFISGITRDWSLNAFGHYVRCVRD